MVKTGVILWFWQHYVNLSIPHQIKCYQLYSCWAEEKHTDNQPYTSVCTRGLFVHPFWLQLSSSYNWLSVHQQSQYHLASHIKLLWGQIFKKYIPVKYINLELLAAESQMMDKWRQSYGALPYGCSRGRFELARGSSHLSGAGKLVSCDGPRFHWVRDEPKDPTVP